MPATESMKGTFQFRPGSATRRNLPNRVITATCGRLDGKEAAEAREKRDKKQNE